MFYAEDCAVCHGETGKGDGVFSRGMNPRPIDLTNKVLLDRLSDDYLYWRVSEGGLEAPFLSAMPAFKDILDDEQRWELIAYVRSIATETEDLPMIGGVDFQVGLNILQTYGCLACHRYNDQGNFVGPDLHDIGVARTADQLLADIIDPSAEISTGFADTMPRDYSEKMTEDDLMLLVDFLAGSIGEYP
ncbi:MAG: c-type cytochrome, partial [Chloroflexaceae bacterium]|nr:c-type cytochrome [Chloroflexaceae bacterium]